MAEILLKLKDGNKVSIYPQSIKFDGIIYTAKFNSVPAANYSKDELEYAGIESMVTKGNEITLRFTDEHIKEVIGNVETEKAFFIPLSEKQLRAESIELMVPSDIRVIEAYLIPLFDSVKDDVTKTEILKALCVTFVVTHQKQYDRQDIEHLLNTIRNY